VAFTIRQALVRERFSLAATGDGGGNFFVGPGTNFPDKSFTFQTGTGTGQVNKAFVGTFALTTSGTTSFDLTTAQWAGTTQNMSTVREIQVALSVGTTADTDPSVFIGPQSISNGAVLCFGTTTGKADVRRWFHNIAPINGWGVTSGNKVVQLTNNGSYPITVNVMVLGTG